MLEGGLVGITFHGGIGLSSRPVAMRAVRCSLGGEKGDERPCGAVGAHLDKSYCRHVGRGTVDRNEHRKTSARRTKKSAYQDFLRISQVRRSARKWRCLEKCYTASGRAPDLPAQRKACKVTGVVPVLGLCRLAGGKSKGSSAGFAPATGGGERGR
jgi:hypothetical protein